jgi:ABC-type dipeptide/oligopeptide/nickel transport system ATPase component
MPAKNIMVIGIAGRKRAGKSTAATAILQLAESRQIPARRIGFAEELKALIADAFDLTTEDCKEQLRPVYQVACDVFKKVKGISLWLQDFDNRCDHAMTQGYELVVVDDVRFPYEAEHLKEIWGAYIIKVTSKDSNKSTDPHPSENNTEFITANTVLENDMTLPEFREAVKQAAKGHL